MAFEVVLLLTPPYIYIELRGGYAWITPDSAAVEKCPIRDLADPPWKLDITTIVDI